MYRSWLKKSARRRLDYLGVAERVGPVVKACGIVLKVAHVHYEVEVLAQRGLSEDGAGSAAGVECSCIYFVRGIVVTLSSGVLRFTDRYLYSRILLI